MGTLSPMLAVEDMIETIKFYEALGFKKRMSYPEGNDPQYVDVVKDGMVLMFTPAKSSLNFFHKKGSGVNLYMMIDGDIDAYYMELKGKNVPVAVDIKDEPFGIRDFSVKDNNGYLLTFNQYIKTPAVCQSCGMPMNSDEDFAGKNSQSIYCIHCTNPSGTLKTYGDVHRGMVDFMITSQKCDRASAERVVTEHMAKMPAWKGMK
jgi:uncharacterized glyoxalase superfamily protein PhnB